MTGIFDKYVKPYNKELTEIVTSSLSAQAKIYAVKASMNNLSKNLFKALNTGSDSSGRYKQVIKTHKGYFAFTVTTDLCTCQCRQYYHNICGFFCYNILLDKVYFVSDDKIHTKVSGTGNETIPASSAEVPIEQAKELSLEEFEDMIYDRC